jgi:hypothetical protein
MIYLLCLRIFSIENNVIIILKLGVITIKGANGITLQKNCDSFLIFFHFFICNPLLFVTKNIYNCPNISHVLC